jgi:hypothetical protein
VGAWKSIGMQAALQSTATAGSVLYDRYAFSDGHVSLGVGKEKGEQERKGEKIEKKGGRKRGKKERRKIGKRMNYLFF